MRWIVVCGAVLVLSGCAALDRVTPDFLKRDGGVVATPQTQPQIVTSDPAPVVAETVAPRPQAGPLGEVVVSLGDPTQPGLWVKSTLVDVPTPGRLITQDGATLTVDLLPLGAAADGGAQISLEALRALGLPLTGLAPITLSAL